MKPNHCRRVLRIREGRVFGEVAFTGGQKTVRVAVAETGRRLVSYGRLALQWIARIAVMVNPICNAILRNHPPSGS